LKNIKGTINILVRENLGYYELKRNNYNLKTNAAVTLGDKAVLSGIIRSKPNEWKKFENLNNVLLETGRNFRRTEIVYLNNKLHRR
jgi:hypothetical protein